MNRPLHRFVQSLVLSLALLSGVATATFAEVTTGERLVLPLYEVEVGDPSGATTLFALRNESPSPVDVSISYYEVDAPQAPQRTETVTLVGKEVYPINVRDVPDLEVDPDGIARGYVVFQGPEGFLGLHGDYFQVTPGDAFATGYRLLNADRDPCSTFSVRFLSGGAFSGGTELLLWLSVGELPLPEAAVSYAIYSEQGGVPLKFDFLDFDVAARRFSVDEILGEVEGLSSGVVEIQLADGLDGHLAATMSASGLYSVGLEAACRD